MPCYGGMPAKPHAGQPDAWRATLSGLCASLVCIGLARFAYTPLLPALIDEHWFSTSAAAYLGATNLAGYLIGVVAAGPLSRRIDPRWLLRGSMLIAATSFFACAWQAGLAWFFVWRLVSGVTGGVAMILAAPTILAHVPPSRHGLVSGAVFMGVGLGIAVSGTIVPLLLQAGLIQTWLGLGAVALILALVGWGGWPHSRAFTPPARHFRNHPRPASRAISYTSATYGLNAFGLVPHMVFLVAYVAHGLGQGLDAGTRYWVVFGLGAIAGPVLFGHLADRIGARKALRTILVVELVFVALPALASGTAALIASSVVVGACTIGVVPVMLARIREVLLHNPSAFPAAWRTATTCFATLQAAGAYGLSFVFSRTAGDYRPLFLIGAFAMLLALLADLFAPADPRVTT